MKEENKQDNLIIYKCIEPFFTFEFDIFMVFVTLGIGITFFDRNKSWIIFFILTGCLFVYKLWVNYFESPLIIKVTFDYNNNQINLECRYKLNKYFIETLNFYKYSIREIQHSAKGGLITKYLYIKVGDEEDICLMSSKYFPGLEYEEIKMLLIKFSDNY